MRPRFMHWLWAIRTGPQPLWWYLVVDVATWIACKAAGHEPERDPCGDPDHDHCAWCKKSMPNQAGPMPSTSPPT